MKMAYYNTLFPKINMHCFIQTLYTKRVNESQKCRVIWSNSLTPMLSLRLWAFWPEDCYFDSNVLKCKMELQ